MNEIWLFIWTWWNVELVSYKTQNGVNPITMYFIEIDEYSGILVHRNWFNFFHLKLPKIYFTSLNETRKQIWHFLSSQLQVVNKWLFYHFTVFELFCKNSSRARKIKFGNLFHVVIYKWHVFNMFLLTKNLY